MQWNSDQKKIVRSGAIWSVYEAFTSGFLIVFAIALGASNTVVGIMGALPYIAMILTEIPGAKLVEFYRRKTIFVVSTALSRCMWFLILITPYLFKEYTLFFVGAFFFLMRCLNHTVDPAWTSWVADIVPEKLRGRFWGQRNMIVGLTGMIATLLAGAYLDLFSKQSYLGFATLFGIGTIIGLWSTKVMAKVKEPEYSDHIHHKIKEFFKVDGQFRKFCWITVAFYFGVNIASPLFSVYMLRNLDLNYTYFVLFGAIATVSRILAQPHFGRITDKFGDKPVALISMLGTALVPLSFIFVTKDTLGLIIPAQIISGVAWAGSDLSMWNLLLDLTQKEKRAMQVAEFNFLTSIPMVVSPVIGGLIADNLKFFLSGIPLVFAIATVLRVIPVFALARLHETRTGPERPVGEVFAHIVIIHPIHGMEHAIRVVVKRIKGKKGFGRILG